jgi:hypothetical protein
MPIMAFAATAVFAEILSHSRGVSELDQFIGDGRQEAAD